LLAQEVEVSRGLNKVLLIGNLGRDPEIRHTAGGKPVTSFSVGVTRTWSEADGQRHVQTEWFQIVAWGGLAEVCAQHLHKGDRVYIEGRLQSREWQDAAGKEQRSTEVVAREMIMLGSGRRRWIDERGDEEQES
jgi:single-strand DNA-binding protein